jgi:sensor histidine kinase YesM
MNKKSPVYKVLLWFFKRLLYVNLIGFAIGFFINGIDIIGFWKEYLLYSTVIGLSLWLGNEGFSVYIDKKYTWLDFPVRKLVLRIVFSLSYSSVVMIIIYMGIWFLVLHKTNLTNFFQYNKYSFLVFYACTVIIMLIFHTIGFFKAWQIAAVNEERLKKESVTLQLQALRNQVNPHFLFNSLNTLTSLIEKDQKLAITFVKQLSDMFRYMLEQDSHETIGIQEEIKFLESYIYLQKMRFGENLKISIDIPDLNHNLVPLSLQMLVENALKHNEVSNEKPFHVIIFEEPDYVVIQNPIQPKMLEVPSKGIGLQNLRSRYKFLSDKEMLILSNESEFIVKLPKLSISA